MGILITTLGRIDEGAWLEYDGIGSPGSDPAKPRGGEQTIRFLTHTNLFSAFAR